ncbi:MAG: hypothetical protein Q8S58_03795 [Bosea sp. (in: a-proteobacteria)]|uniref:hypothetical protein n=1 Tax=Bosea sp. (in: a-proteobacteria) TaxID=1871050 RepID=UPI00273260BF|nr:hypothetical protein [Bosea sp. (in: a-proteobacteria)]MDP3256126.1 hypothetical protein [Bosea sp. (in: a-proteobacteria)]MDP3318232.1 hypothetical protein [Bosea sp. (in: a-proteobacteria)]
MTKTLLAALALTCMTSFAQAQSCAVQAGDKKLAGAAKTSFLTKCEKDATAACDKQAVDKKLAGAAKTSFTKKCVTDSVGT